MEINEELKVRINQADIPKLLKNYLLRNKHIQVLITSQVLNDIQDLYIEYGSLYIFDVAEFCSYVITGLKKQDKHEYFYNYLKIVMDSNMHLVSKHKERHPYLLERMAENIEDRKDQTANYVIGLLQAMDSYNRYQENIDLFIANRFAGILEVIFDMFPTAPFAKDFEEIDACLRNLSIGEK